MIYTDGLSAGYTAHNTRHIRLEGYISKWNKNNPNKIRQQFNKAAGIELIKKSLKCTRIFALTL